MAMRPRQYLRVAVAAWSLMLVLGAVTVGGTAADQTVFPNPFGDDGVFTDIRAGSNGEDIGDAFFLREDDRLQIQMFLDVNDFIETHVCLSGAPFTGRIPPGLCQHQKQGLPSDSYDITLPPSSFPVGTEPFSDPLGSFCVQVHVSYTHELAKTVRGGGGAFAGWQSGKPFYGNLCFADVPDPLPPGEGTAIVSKVGELVGSDVVFTVTATNPTTEPAADVVVLEALPPKLTPWTVPEECTLSEVDFIARCEIGELAGGASVPLIFSATPPAGVCGAFSNYALTTVGSPVVRSADLVIVDVPCPDPPPAPDPLILMTKEPSATAVTAPDTVTYFVTFENAGPGDADNVEFTDELNPDFEWSLGSGSNVCSIEGTTLTCFAATVADGVFEVLEITAVVDATDCGMYDNTGTVTFEGGPEPGSVSATAPTVEITGCSAAPAPSSPSPTATIDTGTGAGGAGDLPDTRIAPRERETPAVPLILVVGAAGLTLLALRRRSAVVAQRSSDPPSRR
jgi:uncharacterized repeat protein (TIGR01451 family)